MRRARCVPDEIITVGTLAAMFPITHNAKARCGHKLPMSTRPTSALLQFSGVAFGSKTIASEEIDAAFGMPAGKLRNRAGIRTLAHAAAQETEVTLAANATRAALQAVDLRQDSLDWIIATSETHHAFPSLAAQLHLAIGAKESCGAMDVGGACLGLLHTLAVAKSFVETGRSNTALVVTADLHSRTLTPGRVAGEFGGLFGDGASAFLVQRDINSANRECFVVKDFFFGCASQLQAAIQVKAQPEDRLHVVFDGDALSRAATARLDQCIRELEGLSGIPREQVAAFATHQPNPRLVALLARKSGVAVERFPAVADTRAIWGRRPVQRHFTWRWRLPAAKKRRRGAPFFLLRSGRGCCMAAAGSLQPARELRRTALAARCDGFWL
jgi:3-oxoacyl-[acyl-carrier-protein] synthase-3